MIQDEQTIDALCADDHGGLLDGLYTIDEIATQTKRSRRTIQRMIERRELAYVDFGRKRLIHGPLSRDALLSRVVKADQRRARRGQR